MKYSPVQNFIGGKFVDTGSIRKLPVISPLDGNPLSEVPMSTSKDLDNAVKAAKAAFPAWSKTPIKERVQVFFRYKYLLEKHLKELSELVQEENGKKSVKGQNATLELTPQQAELVVASQRMSGGTLSLALRSMLDANKTEPVREKDTTVTVVRYGVPGLAGQR